MQDFNSENQNTDYLQLSELCLDICNDKAVKLGDWTQRDIDLFVAQFKEADLEPEIDMDKLDPRPYPRSYFAKKFPGFEDHVIDAIYDCENKKLEDTRLCPLRVLRNKVGSLAIENPTKDYNAAKKENNQEAEEAEGEEDCSAETEATTDNYSTDRARWFTASQEEE